MHQLTVHCDSWAVLDLMEAGASDVEAPRIYEKAFKQTDRKFGVARKKKISAWTEKEQQTIMQEEFIKAVQEYQQQQLQLIQQQLAVKSEISDVKSELGHCESQNSEQNIDMSSCDSDVKSDSSLMEVKGEEGLPAQFTPNQQKHQQPQEAEQPPNKFAKIAAELEQEIIEAQVSEGDIDMEYVNPSDASGDGKLFKYLDTAEQIDPVEEEVRFNAELKQLFAEIDEMLVNQPKNIS